MRADLTADHGAVAVVPGLGVQEPFQMPGGVSGDQPATPGAVLAGAVGTDLAETVVFPWCVEAVVQRVVPLVGVGPGRVGGTRPPWA